MMMRPSAGQDRLTHVSARWRAIAAGVSALGAAVLVGAPASLSAVQAPTPERQIAAESPLIAGQSSGSALAALRQAAVQMTARLIAGDLRRTSSEADALVAGRLHERFAQYYRGVPVFGADTTRQTNAFGQTVSIFGVFYPDITIEVTPRVTADQARALLGLSGGAGAVVRNAPVLTILPVAGGYRLTWTARVGSFRDGIIERTFIDGVTGDTVLTYNDTWTQSKSPGMVGRGLGVVGDLLKVSEAANPSGGFAAIDLLRPGTDTTYDLKGDVNRARALSLGTAAPEASDIATSADGAWRGAVASAQAYAGLALDYYRIRFNRAGIDNQNLQIRCFVNPANPADASTGGIPPSLSDFYNNAFYNDGGQLFFGAGSLTPSGALDFNNFAAGIDVVSHELSHGVTQYTSGLLYQFESGALNESFSDMMSAAVEFMWQPLGTGPATAEWLEGEDVGPGGRPLRSFGDPHSLGAPDHYSLKLVTVLADDDGGVHTNSNIVNHMYYLAIMGGTNRVSRLTVQGVGFDRRDQVEQVIYRAFTTMLPSNATFSVARAATIQAARDLFGVGSAAETAMTQAWTAVGVS